MALRFLNSGYFAGSVGIGTDSPVRLLSLYSDNAETTPRLLIEQDGTGDAVMAFSLTSGQGWSMGIDNSLGDAFMIHNSAGGVDSSSQLTIATDGNVGIGTVSPAQKLHVSNGKVLVDVTSSVGTELILQNLAVDQFAADKNYHEINFITSSTSSETTGGYVRIKAGQEVSGNDNRSYLGFWTAPDDGTVTEKMRITSAGGISFGTTGTAYGTSGQILKSNGNASPTWIDGSAIPGVPAGSGTLNTVAMWTPDGDTLGDSPITISGNNATFAGEITATNIYAETYRSSRSDGEIYIQAATASDFVSIGTQVASNLMRIEGGGNVGIGTTNPTSGKLVIEGDGGYNSNIGFKQSGAQEHRLFAANNVQYNLIGSSAPSWIWGKFTASGTGLDGVPKMIISTGGNVGIGVTSPSAKLDIVGSTLGLRIKKADLSDVLRVYTQGSGIFMDGGNVHISDDLKIGATLLSNQDNTDVDTGTETVANVAIATYTAAFFDFVIKKTTNVRSGTVYACHDGTNVEFTETSTQDLGDTSDVTLSVDISGGNMRLLATVTSDNWSVKSLIRAI